MGVGEVGLITRAEIETLYRALLKREPEDSKVVDQWRTIPTVSDLLEILIASDEYQSQNSGLDSIVSRGASLAWPACLIETEANPTDLDLLLKHIENSWTLLGQTEPYYSVLSTPAYLKNSFDQNELSFFESGKEDVARMISFFGRAGVKLPTNGVCFELGCGVGRLTRWLSGHFEEIIAADISRSHLKLAENNLIGNVPNGKISLIHLDSPERISEFNNYDLFFSLIVLQHNPPPIMSHILRAALRGLNQGGFAYFQIPTYKLGYSFESSDYLGNLTQGGQMEMHVLPQRDIMHIIDQAGCKVLEVREDDYTGHTDGISNTFFVYKKH